MRSPTPLRFSDAFWPVDFWESGVTMGCQYATLKADSKEGILLFSETWSPSPLRMESDMLIAVGVLFEKGCLKVVAVGLRV